jgi:hypothetical protein
MRRILFVDRRQPSCPGTIASAPEDRQTGSLNCGGNLPQGTFNVAIRQVIDGKDRWSNAVRIRIPERP